MCVLVCVYFLQYIFLVYILVYIYNGKYLIGSGIYDSMSQFEKINFGEVKVKVH